MNKLKVLAFADFPSPYRVEVFKGLAAYYDLTVVFNKISDANRNPKWFCRNTGLNSISLLDEDGLTKFHQEILNLQKYDLVLAYDYHVKNAIRLELACIRKKVPYIMNLDGGFIRRNHFRNIMKRILIWKSCACFASGEHAANYFKHFGASPDKIYFHPFTSLHEYDILPEPISDIEKSKYRNKLNLGNKEVVLAVGQFIHRKGFDVLLKSWTKELDEKFLLLIIGGGEEEEQYKSYIDDNNLQSVIIIGYKSREEIFEYYKASSLFVLPTREDIWGLVINEAMAFGVPVISTDMCIGALELIDNGINGYIVKAEDKQELSLKIAEIMNGNNKLRLGEECIRRIRDYTYENVISSHINAINTIMKK